MADWQSYCIQYTSTSNTAKRIELADDSDSTLFVNPRCNRSRLREGIRTVAC